MKSSASLVLVVSLVATPFSAVAQEQTAGPGPIRRFIALEASQMAAIQQSANGERP